MKFITALLISLLLSSAFARPAFGFRPETFYSLTIPVYEFTDPILRSDTLTNVDLIYKLSTPSATRVTWLLGPDSVKSATTSTYFKLLQQDKNQELGLRLEVDASLTQAAFGEKTRSDYTSPKNNLLVGYSQSERTQLIDTAMANFIATFGTYPKTVAAAYLDSFSLEYLQRHYSVQAALLLLDEKTKIIDAYHPNLTLSPPLQPYYPYRFNSIIPATALEEKISLPVITWNLPNSGEGPLISLDKASLADYFRYWEQKSFNEYTHLAIGSDNRLDPKITLAFYPRLFASLKENQEKFSLVSMKLGDFGDWFRARFPYLTPAYSFRDFTSGRVVYGNSLYRAVLVPDEDKARLVTVEVGGNETEAYWQQALTGDLLELPLYNLSGQTEIDLDLKAAKASREGWAYELKADGEKLRFGPEEIVSSVPLTWVEPNRVKEIMKEDYVYQFTSAAPNRIKPVTALILAAVGLLLVYWFHGKKPLLPH